MRVRDVMSTAVITTRPDVPLKEAALHLAREGISGLPVVADDGVVGVLSEADVIAKESTQHGRGGFLAWFLDPGDPWLDERMAARTVGDAMTSPAVVISPDRPLAEAATAMIANGVNRLPVVESGQLIGIVTRADLVRAFVRSDDDLRREIEEDVLRKALWLEPGTVEVTVEDGVVTLAGEMAAEAEVEFVPTFVRRVPGVVAVESRLTAPTVSSRRRSY